MVVLFLTSCAGDAIQTEKKGDYKVEFLFEKGGCKMYRFRDAGSYVYWSDCTGRIEHTTSDGKHSTEHIQITN